MVLLQAASQERDARGDVTTSLVSNVSYFVLSFIIFPRKSLEWLRFLYFVCQEFCIIFPRMFLFKIQVYKTQENVTKALRLDK